MTTTIPSRHPAGPLPVPTSVRAATAMLALPKPDDPTWQRLGERLTVGDEPMDRLVDWMSGAGPDARGMFDRAAADGVASVPDAPEPLRDFFLTVEAIPRWVDFEKVRRGQRAMRRGGADGVFIARDVSLLGGYQFSSFNQTLLRTGALEKGSNQRFAETLQWAIDIIDDDGLRPGGRGYRSTLRVRLIHSYVRRHVAAMDDWDSGRWGLPVNQTDMAATLLGALIAPVCGGFGMGIIVTPRDLDAIAHLTRYVGWLIGVDDEWLPHSFRDGVRIMYHTMTALSEPDDTTQQLAKPMMNDPMVWQYKSFRGLRRRIARLQHLSVTTAFVGPRGMRTLGLPALIPPIYPLIRIPINLTRSVIAMALPGGMDRAADRGYRQQNDWLRTMTGNSHASIGDSYTAKSA